MVIWQLGSCRFNDSCNSTTLGLINNSLPGYLMLGLLTSFIFRAARDALRSNPAAQEKIVGAGLFALTIVDVSRLIPGMIPTYTNHPGFDTGYTVSEAICFLPSETCVLTWVQ